MLDFNKLGDLSKMAQSAKQMQVKQEQGQQEQTQILKKISSQLQEVLSLLRGKNDDR